MSRPNTVSSKPKRLKNISAPRAIDVARYVSGLATSYLCDLFSKGRVTIGGRWYDAYDAVEVKNGTVVQVGKLTFTIFGPAVQGQGSV